MKKLIVEYKDFVNRGNVIAIAVGLVMALYFQEIINAVLDGVINPIIAAIFGEANFEDIGFSIGDAHISIGLVIDAVITFLIVGALLFWIVRLYNRYVAKEDLAIESELSVLKDIREELRASR